MSNRGKFLLGAAIPGTFLILLLAWILPGCSLYYDPIESEVSVLGLEDYAWDKTHIASKFWQKHRMDVAVDPGPAPIEIVVEELDTDAIAQWHGTGVQAIGQIKINAWAKELPNLECAIAHELGHAIGMEHVDEGQHLMSPIQYVEVGRECYWSEQDQDEFCRVHPEQCP